MPRTIYSQTYRALIERLTDARVGARLTQQVVADRLGRPQSYIAKVEGCERRLDVIEFLEIAAAIGVDPAPMIKAAWVEISQ